MKRKEKKSKPQTIIFLVHWFFFSFLFFSDAFHYGLLLLYVLSSHYCSCYAVCIPKFINLLTFLLSVFLLLFRSFVFSHRLHYDGGWLKWSKINRAQNHFQYKKFDKIAGKKTNSMRFHWHLRHIECVIPPQFYWYAMPNRIDVTINQKLQKMWCLLKAPLRFQFNRKSKTNSLRWDPFYTRWKKKTDRNLNSTHRHIWGFEFGLEIASAQTNSNKSNEWIEKNVER